VLIINDLHQKTQKQPAKNRQNLLVAIAF
jgi:hypothetical protein